MATTAAKVLLLLLLLQLAAAADTDRDALMAFKASLSDPSGALSSWNDTVHFCRWAGVSCTEGSVTSLDVSSRRLAGELSPAVANLTRLDVLNLTDNAVSGAIPHSLGRLRRMTYLSLCDNAFTGEVPAALGNCTALTSAYLNDNQLTGGVPSLLGALPNLTILRLNRNLLTGRIPPSLANLTRLQNLILDQNLLEGTIPGGLGALPGLNFFSVYGNRLSGNIPPGFFNMSSLQGFSITNNEFLGELPVDAGAHLPNLLYLFLSGNHLAGAIPASLSNATKLQVLSLANNSFTGQVPGEIGKLCLSSLQLSNNKVTATDAGGWEFLENLTNCSSLREILLDGNKVAGAMPSSITHLSPQLQTLNLAGNRISGMIPPGIGNLAGMQALDLRSNLLIGEIPEVIGKLGNLVELQLHGNRLTGPVPSTIGNLTKLLNLDLSSNLLNGTIPPTLGNLQVLTLFNLSGNKLAGNVPREVFSLPSLSSVMDLSDNKLDGVLPRDVGQLGKLALMALARNRFSGEVPAELASCQSLEFLDLGSNSFSGSIPLQLSRLKGLRRLNLTSNRLSGSIPPELEKMTGLQELYLSWNDLTGDIPASLENMSSLLELDLSHNRLTGQVPLRGVFTNTTGFKMAGNGALCGGAPQLRLPPCPPPASSTRRAHPFLKIGLPIIAGVALLLATPIVILHWRKRKSRVGGAAARSMLNGNYYPRVSYAELAKATDDFAAANLVGAGKYGAVYQGTLSLKAKGAVGGHEHVDAAVAVKVFDLRQAGGAKTFLTECEALRSVRHRNLISIVTCCSSVDAEGNEFRALVFDFMPNSSLDKWLHPEPAELKIKGGTLSIVQRLNIAVDIADALSYLHHSSNPPIVHCDLKPSNVLLDENMTAHVGDFGLAKLLLDPVPNSDSTIGIRGTIGYVAPEYGTSWKISTSGDVYSFGITLLELLTGKAPTDNELSDNGVTLPEFVGSVFPEKIEQVVDPALTALIEVEDEGDVASAPMEAALPACSEDRESEARASVRDCVVAAMRVALSCARRTPCERMVMRDAAAEMRLIRDASLRHCGR